MMCVQSIATAAAFCFRHANVNFDWVTIMNYSWNHKKLWDFPAFFSVVVRRQTTTKLFFFQCCFPHIFPYTFSSIQLLPSAFDASLTPDAWNVLKAAKGTAQRAKLKTVNCSPFFNKLQRHQQLMFMNISNKHIFNEGIICHGNTKSSPHWTSFSEALPEKLRLRNIYDFMKAGRGPKRYFHREGEKKRAPASEVLLFMVRGKRLLIGELN